MSILLQQAERREVKICKHPILYCITARQGQNKSPLPRSKPKQWAYADRTRELFSLPGYFFVLVTGTGTRFALRTCDPLTR